MTHDQESLLDDLLDTDDAGFTAWEMDFLENLDQERRKVLSEKQEVVLNRIATKAGLINPRSQRR